LKKLIDKFGELLQALIDALPLKELEKLIEKLKGFKALPDD
jgi:hypothetical protein